MFRQRYPDVLLDESRMLVPCDVGVTAGAAMGHLDLALWLIRRASPELASVVSRYLLADIRFSQAPVHHSQSSGAGRSAHSSLRALVAHQPEERILAGEGSQRAGNQRHAATSLRSRAQQITALLFKGPAHRARAISLLHGSGLDIDAIATEVGYADGATPSNSVASSALGRGVRDLRAALR